MSKLTSAQRNRLPHSDFAIPEKRAYPIPDENHAHAALSMVAKYGSPAEQHQVRSKVKKKFPSVAQQHGINDGDADDKG